MHKTFMYLIDLKNSRLNRYSCWFFAANQTFVKNVLKTIPILVQSLFMWVMKTNQTLTCHTHSPNYFYQDVSHWHLLCSHNIFFSFLEKYWQQLPPPPLSSMAAALLCLCPSKNSKSKRYKGASITIPLSQQFVL